MRIILIRHTETDWNKCGRLEGHQDVRLNEHGIEEAFILARILKPLRIDRIFSSDLRRTIETAKVINKTVEVPLEIDERFRECSFGALEGLTRHEVIAIHGISLERHLDDLYQWYDFTKFGGENRAEVFRRHFDAFQSIVSAHSDKTILIVGHERGLATVLAGMGHPPFIPQGEYRDIGNFPYQK